MDALSQPVNLSTSITSRPARPMRLSLSPPPLALLLLATVAAGAQTADPRVGLRAGWTDAAVAARHMELVAHRDRPTGFVNASNAGDFGVINSDLAFRGNLLFQGNFNGFQIWDISNPASPTLRATHPCAGGQGDPSVIGNLLFTSVEETRGRVDCGGGGVRDTASAERFRGVRIFDISDLAHPRQVAAVQTCRGSHTHTLVQAPNDRENVYVYVSGTAGARPASELAGCAATGPEDPNTAYFRIEVIKVPLARPQDARVVNSPRIFADSAGRVAGLWKGGAHGPGTQETALTDQCHDITVYSAVGLAAGACAGNGILLDISDPANPRRIDEVSDPNFAYWHSATFSNDASKVVFTDEWGGGVAPRCRATDRPEWGADAIFTLEGRKLRQSSYFKLPAAQTATENCVAHNGSLVPIPGRDVMVQGWYQGGVSVFDFTDPAHPKEIAFFDRGPVSATEPHIGGSWAAYWYNGYIYSSEIARGLDVFRLLPSEFLTRNEIEAARLARVDLLNPQNQQRIVWPAAFVVARAYVDGLVRGDGLRQPWGAQVMAALDRAERVSGAARRTALTQLATRLDRDAAGADSARVRALAGVVRDLAR
jgi:hypothetical protein